MAAILICGMMQAVGAEATNGGAARQGGGAILAKAWGRPILPAMPYIAIEVDEPPADPYWTLLDASGGRDLRAEHKYATKIQAEEVADLLNGVEPDA